MKTFGRGVRGIVLPRPSPQNNLSYKKTIRRLLLVILSAVKNLSSGAAEIRNEAALRSE
jgi:hypothetical protein